MTALEWWNLKTTEEKKIVARLFLYSASDINNQKMIENIYRAWLNAVNGGCAATTENCTLHCKWLDNERADFDKLEKEKNELIAKLELRIEAQNAICEKFWLDGRECSGKATQDDIRKHLDYLHSIHNEVL